MKPRTPSFVSVPVVIMGYVAVLVAGIALVGWLVGLLCAALT